jgi:hypothetical protein
MERVSFITVETGDDLIVSFAVQATDDPMEIDTLTLLRSPKFEFALEDDERGVSVSFERDRKEEDDWLVEVRYSAKEYTVYLKTRRRAFLLDLRKVAPDELVDMRNAFRKMNFDDRMRMLGV